MLLDRHYCDTKNEVIKAERKLLFALGFVVHVNHPHKLIYAYINSLGEINNHDFMQTAWNYMNDGLRTDIFLRYRPQTIACACIDLSSKTIPKAVPLPREPVPWYEAFGASDRDVQQISILILQLYAKTRPPNWSRLNEQMIQLRSARRNLVAKGDGAPNKRLMDERIAAIVEKKRREVEDKAAAMQKQNGVGFGKDVSKEGNADKEHRHIREKENDRYNANHSASSSSRSRSRSRSPIEPRKFRSANFRRHPSMEREHERIHKHSRHHSHRQRIERRRAREDRRAERFYKGPSDERIREERRKNADRVLRPDERTQKLQDSRREREKDVYQALGKRRHSSDSPPPPMPKFRR